MVSYLAYRTGIHEVRARGSQLYYKERFLAIVYCSPIIYTFSFINFSGGCECEYICNFYVVCGLVALAITLAHLTSEDSQLIRDVYERRRKGFSIVEEILFFIIFDTMFFTLGFSIYYLKEIRV